MVLSVTAFWYALNFVKADTKKRLRTSNFEFFFASFSSVVMRIMAHIN